MKMTDEELLAALDAAEGLALGPTTSEIASDRADAIDRYLGKAYGDEQPGRSSVVSRDVSDVVEGVCANVLKPFVAGDQIVEFNPRGPEDEEAAQQETDYVNFVALERNNGFVTLNCAVKDALLLRNGYVKCGWTKREDVMLETYQGLSDDELNAILQDKDVEVAGHAEYPDPYYVAPPMPPMGAMGQPPQQPGMGAVPPAPPPPPMLHDLKLKRKGATEYVETLPCPPAEIMVSARSTEASLQNADFVQHRTHKTLSELRQLGYKVDDDLSDDDNGDTVEDFARQQFGSAGFWDDNVQDAARKIVLFKETWMRVDRDGDGIAELRRICSVGQNLLADEEAEFIPIACFTSVIMPHRHLGVSVYDLIKDIAQIKTALTRGFLDNLYLSTNAEKIVNIDNVVDVNDFLISRPGGIKRVTGDPNVAVMPLLTPSNGQGALQGLEYMDAVRENRTGYTRSAQGMDSNSLATQTATGYMQQVSQSQMRLEMISRTIAETGLRDMFRLIHALTLKHSTREEKVRLRNKWVTVNPREWVRRTDLSISVGLGSVSGQQQIQNLMLIGQAQQTAMPLGIVKPDNIYNTLKKLATAAGFKNPEEFFTAPEMQPVMGPNGQPQMGADGKPKMAAQTPQPPKDPLVQVEEIKQQGKQAEMQQTQSLKQQEMQQSLTLQQSNDQRQAELDQRKIQMDLQKTQMEFEFKKWLEAFKAGAEGKLQEQKMAHESQLEQWKTQYTANHQATMNANEMASRTSTERERMHHDSESKKLIAKSAGVKVDDTDKVTQTLAPILASIEGHIKASNAPKEIVLEASGRAVGVRPLQQ